MKKMQSKSRAPSDNPTKLLQAKHKNTASKLTMGLPEFSKTGELQTTNKCESLSLPFCVQCFELFIIRLQLLPIQTMMGTNLTRHLMMKSSQFHQATKRHLHPRLRSRIANIWSLRLRNWTGKSSFVKWKFSPYQCKRLTT